MISTNYHLSFWEKKSEITGRSNLIRKIKVKIKSKKIVIVFRTILNKTCYVVKLIINIFEIFKIRHYFKVRGHKYVLKFMQFFSLSSELFT